MPKIVDWGFFAGFIYFFEVQGAEGDRSIIPALGQEEVKKKEEEKDRLYLPCPRSRDPSRPYSHQCHVTLSVLTPQSLLYLRLV